MRVVTIQATLQESRSQRRRKVEKTTRLANNPGNTSIYEKKRKTTLQKSGA